MASPEPAPRIEVRGLAIAARGEVVAQGLDFEVEAGKVLAITGENGSGKSLLLRHMIGLQRPVAGEVSYDGEAFWAGSEADRERIKRRIGVLFQGAVLLSGMTLLENVSVKVRLNTTLDRRDAEEVAALKLAILGLRGYERHYPSEVNEGQRARAAVARAISLDPEVLFFDDPEAGLDPLAARRLDDVILGLREATGASIVLVSHDLDTLHALADDVIFLDAERKTMIARGRPQELRDHSKDPKVHAFMNRGRL